jgi:hypothetical protein
MFGTPRLQDLMSLDDDFSDHMRMQATEVVEGTGAGEREGKRIVSIERLRSEYLVLVDHRMRDIVAPTATVSSGGVKLKLSIVITLAASCAATAAAANIAPTIEPMSIATMTARLIANRAAARRTNLCPRSSKPFLVISDPPCGASRLETAPNCTAK